MDFLKALVAPSSIIFLLLALGILVRALFGWRRTSYALLIVSGFCALIFSSGYVATSLLSPLEYRYPALLDPSEHSEAKHIVVLASYAVDDQTLPISTRVNSNAAFRVLEALAIYRRCPDCKVIVSGEDSVTRVIGELLKEMGVDESRLILETESYNTSRSAANLKDVLAKHPFFLVTSAGHMPRSMGVFEKLGMKPIPAPTDYQLPKDPHSAILQISPLHLYYSDLAVHEYLAIAWFRIRGLM